jgi:hypothetical protein
VSYQTVVQGDSPVDFYRLGASSGTTESDLGSAGRTLTYAPGSGSWSGGTLGATGPISGDATTAATFNGTTGYAEAGSHVKASTASSGTIEAWIYPTATNPTQQVVVGWGSDGSSNGLRMSIHDVFGTGSRRLLIMDRTGSNYVYGNTVLSLNTWYHVVAQSSGSAWLLYVNAALQTLTASGANSGAWFGSITASGTPWTTIGAAQRFGSLESFFAGSVANVAIYDTVLTSTQVNNHFTATGGGGGGSVGGVDLRPRRQRTSKALLRM